jgi:hypothetical protein
LPRFLPLYIPLWVKHENAIYGYISQRLQEQLMAHHMLRKEIGVLTQRSCKQRLHEQLQHERRIRDSTEVYIWAYKQYFR